MGPNVKNDNKSRVSDRTDTSSANDAALVIDSDDDGLGRLTSLENKVEELQRLVDERDLEVARLKDASSPARTTSKRGYLFKWQDRTLGWGGTKWALRFVQLDNRGRLSYFRTHNDLAPRYVLTLKQCGVRDEGFKVNGQSDYFFVFSIYQRSKKELERKGHDNSGDLLDEDDEEDEDDEDEEEEYVPLLRFSTQSLAEKQQWIKVLRESIKFCDSPDFLKVGGGESEDKAALAETLRKYGQYPIALNEVGTLPPIYFGLPALPKPKRLPSFSRLRQSPSGESLSKQQQKERMDLPPSKPMHREAAPSFLSEDASEQNYRGLLNLALIILVASNFRILYDNIRSNGFVLWQLQGALLRDVRTEWISGGFLLILAHLPFFSGMASLPAFVFLGYFIEYLASRRCLNNGLAMFLHAVNSLTTFLVSTWITWYSLAGRPVYGIILLMHAVIASLKLWSYAHANSDFRAKSKSPHGAVTQQQLALVKDVDEDSDAVQYPDNVTISNMLYFWFAPTLTYQIAFPRSPKFRPLRFISIVLRLILAVAFLTFIFTQVVTPVLNDLLQDLDKRAAANAGKEESWWEEKLFTAGIFTEYILRLAIANTYGWLAVFYAYFHLYLNLFAEMLRFGDRVFYKDWWNSSNVSAYWRLWNMPVHYWLVRHLYFPCIRRKWSRTMATVAVFFVSAVMHEALISIPFHMIRPWSFLAMMGQLPLAVVTKYFDKKAPGSSVGNVIFWMSFCMVGQPMAFLLYTIDYRKYHSDGHQESTTSLFGFGGGEKHSEL